MSKRFLIWLLVGALALSACALGGQASPSSPPAGVLHLDGRTFLSASVTDSGTDRPLVPGTRIQLGFRADRLTASAGCNTMGGRYAVIEGTFRLRDAAVTEIGCDPARQAQDDWLFGLLGSGPTLELSGNELSIRAGDTVIQLLDREVAEPDVPLTGRVWTLESIIIGDAVSSIPAGVIATIEFTVDGGVSVETGCNSGTGNATIGPNTLRVSNLGTTKRACLGGPDAVERAVLDVLRADAIAYVIDGPLLRLRADDLGLDFRA